jgi:cephalosporin hydroxylase
LIDEVHEVTLTVRVNGSLLATKKYSQAGRDFPRFEVPPALLKRSPAVVECELDRWGKDRATGRDVGLIVVGVSLVHPDRLVVGHDVATELARQGYLRLLDMRQFQLPRDKQNEMMKLFHDIPVWRHMWFHNVQIDKNPLDLWMMQQVIYEVQPEFIVETGTALGGSALYWAHTLNGMGLVNSRVLTVDINELPATAPTHPLWKKYVTFFRGSSTDPAIVAQIGQRVRGHKTLVTLDSDHSMKHVLDELHSYSPMVSRGSYLIVEDTHIDGIPTQPGAGPGPMAAVLEFLGKGSAGKAFEQDFSREAYIMTFNPGGWLRRK